MAREQLKNLTEPMYYVLLSLIKENHGYGIMQLIDELTDSRVAVGAGTLYALLGRFEKEKIITQIAEENRRKTYGLTEKGLEILKDEYERLNKMVSDGRKFMEYADEQTPPTNMGEGITMLVEELTQEVKGEAEAETTPEREVLPEEENVPKKETAHEKEKNGKSDERKLRKGFGGFGKGVVFPV